MARASPITIGLGVLAAAVFAAAIFVIARPRRAEPPQPIDLAAEPPAPTPARAAPAVAAEARVRAPQPSAAPEPIPAEPAPPVAAIVTDNPATGNEAVVTAAPTTTNLGLMRNHNRRLDEADEEAFKSLSLPDATRARVRAINDELRKRTEGDVSPSNVQGAVQARRDQLRLLLGADGARQFDIEERGAVRRLRGKYRFEWGQQGRGK